MGLLKILKKIKAREKEMRLLMLGLDSAGKTTLVKSFNKENVQDTSPTLGFSIKTIIYNAYKLNIWDVGGQKSLRSFWKNYFESTDGLIWVVDSSDLARLHDCAKLLHELIHEERLKSASLLIFANKQDLEGSLGEEEIIRVLRLDEVRGRDWKLVTCSAFTGQGVEQGMSWIVHNIAQRIYMLK